MIRIKSTCEDNVNKYVTEMSRAVLCLAESVCSGHLEKGKRSGR